MKIEIWADVVCPYCYLGKRRLELALADTKGVDVVWHSFQLDPSLETQGGKSLNDYVAELRGQPREWAVRIHQQLVEDGKEVGLEYDFDKAVVANSFDAHRLIHLAKARGRGNEAEDRLFRAYFAEGKNIADHATLASLGKEIGLESADVEKMLGSKAFSKDVLADEKEADSLGIDAVPFFLFDRKRAVIGAQPVEVFRKELRRSKQMSE